MKNFSTSLREHATNTINLKKNVNINKKNFAKMTPRYDRMLHLWKKIAKILLVIKKYRKVRDRVVKLNIVVQYIVYVI